MARDMVASVFGEPSMGLYPSLKRRQVLSPKRLDLSAELSASTSLDYASAYLLRRLAGTVQVCVEESVPPVRGEASTELGCGFPAARSRCHTPVGAFEGVEALRVPYMHNCW